MNVCDRCVCAYEEQAVKDYKQDTQDDHILVNTMHREMAKGTSLS